LPTAGPQTPGAFAGVASALDAWVNAEVDRSRDLRHTATAGRGPFLADHVAVVGELRSLLATGQPPRFADEARVFGRLQVEPHAMLRLHWVLVADCLEASSCGDAERTEQALLAIWNLDQSLLDQADTHTFQMALEAVKVTPSSCAGRWTTRPGSSASARVTCRPRRGGAEEAWLWVDGVLRSWASQGGPWPPLRRWPGRGCDWGAEVRLTLDVLGGSSRAAGSALTPGGGQLWQQRVSPATRSRLAWSALWRWWGGGVGCARAGAHRARAGLRAQADELGGWPGERGQAARRSKAHWGCGLSLPVGRH
jgi:hypothetical protein